MAGLPQNVATQKEIIALLENALDQALSGKLDFVCVLYGITGTDNITGSWRGTDNAKKVLNAVKGLKALEAKILETNTDPEK